MNIGIRLNEEWLEERIQEVFNGYINGFIDRYDAKGDQIRLGDTLLCRNGRKYKVVFADDILAFGLENEYGEFEFMSEWISDSWEIVREE